MRNILILLLMVGSFVSCDNSLKFSRYKATTNGNWSKDDIVSFELTELDTISAHNVFIMIRNDNTYPYSNLFLIAQMTTPDQTVIRDTIEYEMAAPDGRWLGKGAGSIHENKLWYREKIVFTPPGVYTIEISHAMRQNGKVEGIDNLIGITDVGIEIELTDE